MAFIISVSIETLRLSISLGIKLKGHDILIFAPKRLSAYIFDRATRE